jgi:hypothetical protein
MTDIAKAIVAIKPDAQFYVVSNDVNKIGWRDNNPTNITNEQILAKQAELKADFDAKQYQRDRKEAYPSIEDQLDDIYHNGVDGWKATIKVTKDKYPKS